MMETENYSLATMERFAALPAKKRRSMASILRGDNISETASIAKVARTTVYAWRDEPGEFKSCLEAMRREQSRREIDTLTQLQQTAAEGLAAAMQAAQLELGREDGDRISAMHFLSACAERLMIGFGVGPGGKTALTRPDTGADECRADSGAINFYRMHLPSNDRDDATQPNSARLHRENPETVDAIVANFEQVE